VNLQGKGLQASVSMKIKAKEYIMPVLLNKTEKEVSIKTSISRRIKRKILKEKLKDMPSLNLLLLNLFFFSLFLLTPFFRSKRRMFSKKNGKIAT